MEPSSSCAPQTRMPEVATPVYVGSPSASTVGVPDVEGLATRKTAPDAWVAVTDTRRQPFPASDTNDDVPVGEPDVFVCVTAPDDKSTVTP